jgi:hypothetical protein
MRSLTIEQVLLLALFILVPLFNLLVRWLRQRVLTQQPDAGPQAPPEPAGDGRPPQPSELPPVTVPPRIRRGAAAARAVEEAVRPRAIAATAPPRRARRRSRPLHIGTVRNLRRAIVLMAVLGPCRAQETAPPPGSPGPSTP